MTFYDEYIEFVKTKSCAEGQAFKLAHGVTGLITEHGELLDCFKRHIFYGEDLDTANVKEELGDLYWYSVEYLIGLSLTKRNITCAIDILNEDLGCCIDNPFIELGTGVFNLQKCAWELSKSFDLEHSLFLLFGDCVFHVKRILRSIDEIASDFNWTREEVMKANMAKLGVRYEEGFTKEEAIDRDLKAEKAALL